MSIKEKVQQIIQQAEAEKAAELRRQEEARLRLAIEAQKLSRQRETKERVLIEEGEKVVDALGFRNVLEEVFDLVKQEDPEVELRVHTGSVRYACMRLGNERILPRSLSVTSSSEPGFQVRQYTDFHSADTVGVFVEKFRSGYYEHITGLGVQWEIGDPDKIWIYAAELCNPGDGSYPFDLEKDLLLAKDPELLTKIEDRLAEHIANGRHRRVNYPSGDSLHNYGW